MFDQYCVNLNAQRNGDHEVHNIIEGCRYLPNPESQENLGWHVDYNSVVKEAKKYGFETANDCWYCCNKCSAK